MTHDSIRTTLADAALAGVTDDPDVTAAVADVEPDATLTACRANDPQFFCKLLIRSGRLGGQRGPDNLVRWAARVTSQRQLCQQPSRRVDRGTVAVKIVRLDYGLVSSRFPAAVIR